MLKKKIEKDIQILILEAQRSTRIALVAIGFSMIAIAIPTYIDLSQLGDFGKAIFVITYIGFGTYIMISEIERLYKINKEIEGLKKKSKKIGLIGRIKMKEKDWRSAELVMAATLGGVISYFVTKFYDTQDYIWAGVILLMMVLMYVFVRIFNHFRPDL